MPVYVTGSGSYLPGPRVAFDDIEQVLGRLTQAPPRLQRWIEQTTPIMKQLLGIEFYHYAIDRTTRAFTDDNVTMSAKAARVALDAAGMTPQDVDLICYGSPHQDQMPTASVRIQEQLGIERCDELSIHANCTSAYKALYLAHQLIRSGQNSTALVISANIASSELRAEYYNQALVDKESLFLRWFLCDGAGALVLTNRAPAARRFVVEQTYIESVGGTRPSLMFSNRPAYWMNPQDEFDTASHHLRQQFRNVLSTSVFQEPDGSVFANGLKRMLGRGSVPLDSVAFFQVNLPSRHIADSVREECRALGIAPEAFYTKMSEMGYAGPPTALMCLDRILREERPAPGQRVLSFVTEVSKFMQAGYVIACEGAGSAPTRTPAPQR